MMQFRIRLFGLKDVSSVLFLFSVIVHEITFCSASFPWFPSVIVSKDDLLLIPHEVQKAGRERGNPDKYLIKYYDRDGSWYVVLWPLRVVHARLLRQYVTLKDMVKMFEDESLYPFC